MRKTILTSILFFGLVFPVWAGTAEWCETQPDKMQCLLEQAMASTKVNTYIEAKGFKSMSEEEQLQDPDARHFIDCVKKEGEVINFVDLWECIRGN